MNIRSDKLLLAAKGQSCVCCGVRDGTVVAAHYQGMRSHMLGKGKGIKAHDLCIADLCVKCHTAFDTGSVDTYCGESPFAKKIDQSEQFLFLIIKTLLRRVEQGILKTDDLEEIP